MDSSMDLSVRIDGSLEQGSVILTSLGDALSAASSNLRRSIQVWIEDIEGDSPDLTTLCRDCGNVANYLTKRVGYVRTQFGLIRYWRACYSCTNCHCNTYPMDERLNPVESLARLRTKIAAGKNLPVSKLAQAWGLGDLSSWPIYH